MGAKEVYKDQESLDSVNFKAKLMFVLSKFKYLTPFFSIMYIVTYVSCLSLTQIQFLIELQFISLTPNSHMPRFNN